MRVRILRDFVSGGRSFRVGEVANVDPGKAPNWLRDGLVMKDKSLDGASETKVESHHPSSGDERLGDK